MNHEVFPIARGSPSSLWFCAGLGFVLVVAAVQVGTIPITTRDAALASFLRWLVIPLGVLLPLTIAALLGYLAYCTRAARFVVSDEGLRIRGDMFGRLIPRSSLLIEDAQVLDLKQESAHRPVIRTFGVGMPGYSSGWFLLNDHGKALLFMTDPSRAVYLPTTAGYSLLFSPAEPERLMAALKA